MISKDAIRRGYNRGNYVVGAPTPPHFADTTRRTDDRASLQQDPVPVGADALARLRATGAAVATTTDEVVAGTRDWWARSMIAETSGRPAATVAAVVAVTSAEQVAQVLRIASGFGLPVTPSAGRSNVTGAAIPVRGGIVLDVCGLDRILDVDRDSQIVEVEAGVFGDVLEERLQREYGLTLGHWPSSFAISTVGGWVACRGAGQLSTRYGKIEHMVHGLDVVLADGTTVTVGETSGAAVGPALQELFVGSEGTLGVITRIRFRAHRVPDHARAVAYGFPTFAAGLEACRQIMQSGATPAVLRLYDGLESGVQFGLPDTNVLLVADEGRPRLVDAVIAESVEVCAGTGTELDGDAIFERWLDTRYLTGKSAEGFTRSAGFVADTLEMAGRWRDLPAVYDEVVAALRAVPGTLAGSAHQSHAYVDGACLYFSLRGEVAVADRADWYRAAWDAANAVLLKYEATLSHHHGVGLLRSPYLRSSLGAGHDVLRSVKGALDPQGLLNPAKLGL